MKTVEGEAFPCNSSDARSSRPDARSSRLDTLQQNMKLLLPVRTLKVLSGRRRLARNSLLTYFKISKVYLNGLPGIVSLRIP
jgi:hypothetical protein